MRTNEMHSPLAGRLHHQGTTKQFRRVLGPDLDLAGPRLDDMPGRTVIHTGYTETQLREIHLAYYGRCGS